MTDNSSHDDFVTDGTEDEWTPNNVSIIDSDTDNDSDTSPIKLRNHQSNTKTHQSNTTGIGNDTETVLNCLMKVLISKELIAYILCQ